MKNRNSIFSKLLVTVMFILINSGLFSQNIIDIKNYPTNPTNSDNIQVFTENLFSSGSCWLDSSNMMIDGYKIICNGYYGVGMMAVMCTTYDTFHIGHLNDGTYQFHFYLYMSGNSTIADSAKLSFTVGSVGFDEGSKETSGILFPNPSDGTFYLKIPEEIISREIIFTLFTTEGKQLKKIHLRSASNIEKIDLKHLKEGNYLYTLYLKNSHYYYSGMLFKMNE